MGMLKISLTVCAALLIFCSEGVFGGEICIADDMRGGSSSLLSQKCEQDYYKRFTFHKYEYLSNPLGSDYHMTTTDGENNCGVSDFIEAKRGIDIIVHYYTFNNGTRTPWCNLNFIGNASGGIRLTVDDTRMWRNATLHVDRSTHMQFKLDCSLSAATEFFAVGNIWFLTDDVEDCPLHSTLAPNTTTPQTTTTDTTTEPPETTTEAETTTEEPEPETTIDPTVTCIEDAFETGDTTLFINHCEASYFRHFEFHMYDENFTNPIGSDHYMTTQLEHPNCGIGNQMSVTAGSRVVVNYFTTNNSTRRPICSLNYKGNIWGGSVIAVDNAGEWRNHVLPINENGFMQLQLNCEVIDEDMFLAFGKISILSNGEENCPVYLTTTTTEPSTTTTEEPTTIDETVNCIEDDFDGGFSTFLDNDCEASYFRRFEFGMYDEEIVNLTGSSHFMTTQPDHPNCGLSNEMNVRAENSIAVSYYTRNNGTNTAVCSLNYKGSIFGGSVVAIDNSMMWRTAVLNIIGDGVVQVEVNCEILDSNMFLAIGKISIVSIGEETCPDFVTTTTTTTEATTTVKYDANCFSDNFGYNYSSLLNNRCDGDHFGMFEIKAYSEDGLTNPIGSDYYMTTGSGTPTCGISDFMSTKSGNKVTVEYFTSNNGTGFRRCTLSNRGRSFDAVTVLVTNENAWRNITLNLSTDDDVQIQIDCEPLVYPTMIFAIGNIWIDAEDAEDCPEFHTTTTEPTTTPGMEICIDDDFESGYSSLLSNACEGDHYSTFEYQKYDGVFNNSIGSDYYMTTPLSRSSCGISDGMSIKSGNVIIFNYYTANMGTGFRRCTLSYRGTVFRAVNIVIDDSRAWRTLTFNVEYDGNVQLQVDCDPLDGNFTFAVGKIGVSADTSDDCPVLMSTTTPEPTTVDRNGICIHDNIGSGYSTLFSESCDGDHYLNFVYKSYDGSLFNPMGSDYYMTTQLHGPNCGVSRPMSINNGTSIVLNYYTASNSTMQRLCYITYRGTDIGVKVIVVNNAMRWRNVTLDVETSGDVQIELDCESLDDGMTFAVGNVWLLDDVEENCPTFITTTPAPETTTPEYYDGTCQHEDFRNGNSSLLGNSCDGDHYSRFLVNSFDGEFNNSIGSDNYLITQTGSPSCGISNVMATKPGPRVVLNYYTRNNGSMRLCNLSIRGETLDGLMIIVNNEQRWKNATLTIRDSGNLQLQLDCDRLDGNAFLAVGNIWVFDDDRDNCPAAVTKSLEIENKRSMSLIDIINNYIF